MEFTLTTNGKSVPEAKYTQIWCVPSECHSIAIFSSIAYATIIDAAFLLSTNASRIGSHSPLQAPSGLSTKIFAMNYRHFPNECAPSESRLVGARLMILLDRIDLSHSAGTNWIRSECVFGPGKVVFHNGQTSTCGYDGLKVKFRWRCNMGAPKIFNTKANLAFSSCFCHSKSQLNIITCVCGWLRCASFSLCTLCGFAWWRARHTNNTLIIVKSCIVYWRFFFSFVAYFAALHAFSLADRQAT